MGEEEEGSRAAEEGIKKSSTGAAFFSAVILEICTTRFGCVPHPLNAFGWWPCRPWVGEVRCEWLPP